MKALNFRNKTGKLRVAANQRYLEFADGTPFLYLADTAWELFHRLNLEEAQHYLRNRAAKGFTVIQAVLLAELDGISEPNALGDLPLHDANPATPNEAYFRHVDAILECAESLGLFIGILPTWGCYWKHDGRSTSIFTPANARSYGQFVGQRYKNRAVIWILGGDQNPENETELAIIEAMAEGIRAGDGGAGLMSFHPRGPGRSAEYFHHAGWLDFNMCQSSHGARDHDNGLFIAADHALSPPKPALDGEPRYETMPVGFYYRDQSRLERFDDYDMRQAAYWAMMAGACGHTYGHNNIWQMWQPGREARLWANQAWHESLDHPGAFQMGHLRRLFEAYPFQDLRPAPEMLLDAPSSGAGKVRALRSEQGNLAFIYSPMGQPFTINKQLFSVSRLRELWFDPRYGSSSFVHVTTNAAFQTYTPPCAGRGQDWLLILEAEPHPGS